MSKKSNKHVEDQMKRALNSFKSDIPPKLDPWFYDRLMNRIELENNAPVGTSTSWWIRAVKPGLLAGLVAVNIVMLVWMSTSTTVVSGGRSTQLESLATQYGLDYNTAYLIDSGGE